MPRVGRDRLPSPKFWQAAAEVIGPQTQPAQRLTEMACGRCDCGLGCAGKKRLPGPDWKPPGQDPIRIGPVVDHEVESSEPAGECRRQRSIGEKSAPSRFVLGIGFVEIASHNAEFGSAGVAGQFDLRRRPAFSEQAQRGKSDHEVTPRSTRIRLIISRASSCPFHGDATHSSRVGGTNAARAPRPQGQRNGAASRAAKDGPAPLRRRYPLPAAAWKSFPRAPCSAVPRRYGAGASLR